MIKKANPKIRAAATSKKEPFFVGNGGQFLFSFSFRLTVFPVGSGRRRRRKRGGGGKREIRVFPGIFLPLREETGIPHVYRKGGEVGIGFTSRCCAIVSPNRIGREGLQLKEGRRKAEASFFCRFCLGVIMCCSSGSVVSAPLSLLAPF